MVNRLSGVAVVGVLFMCSVACSSATTETKSKLSQGDPCVTGDECTYGLCAVSADGSQVCQTPCTATSNCPPSGGGQVPNSCGSLADGTRVCVAQCDGYEDAAMMLYGKVSKAACWNGVTTPCELLPPDQTCGCGCGETEYCQPTPDGKGGACAALVEPGKPCTTNASCKSGMCNTPVGGGTAVCSVAIGADCTPSNCATCLGYNATTKVPGICTADCSSLSCPGTALCLTLDRSTPRCFAVCDLHARDGACAGTTGQTCKSYEDQYGTPGYYCDKAN